MQTLTVQMSAICIDLTNAIETTKKNTYRKKRISSSSTVSITLQLTEKRRIHLLSFESVNAFANCFASFVAVDAGGATKLYRFRFSRESTSKQFHCMQMHKT